MASNNTEKNKDQTGRQGKTTTGTFASQTQRSLEKPLSKLAYNQLVEHINSLDIDKLIKNNYVNYDLCTINSFRERIQKRFDDIPVEPTKGVIDRAELRTMYKNIEEIPLILQKKKPKRIKDPDGGNMSCSTTLPTASCNTSLAIKRNILNLHEILMDYKNVKIKTAAEYLNIYNESKKKINELLGDKKSQEAQNAQLDSYYEQAKKLHKILEDFGKVIQKDDNAINKNESYAFTKEQEDIIECIANSIEHYFFIQENHHKLYINSSYDGNNSYSYEELEQLTDVVTELLQSLN